MVQLANAKVALIAQQSPNLARLMAVIDGKPLQLAGLSVSPSGLRSTDGAPMVLDFSKFFVSLWRKTVQAQKVVHLHALQVLFPVRRVESGAVRFLAWAATATPACPYAGREVLFGQRQLAPVTGDGRLHVEVIHIRRGDRT